MVAAGMNATQQLVGHYTFEPDSNQFAKSINLGLGVVGAPTYAQYY